MNPSIRTLTEEAHEIIVNIRCAALQGEITWAQRDELMQLVMTDVREQITLAGNLLYDWTGIRYSADLPQGA